MTKKKRSRFRSRRSPDAAPREPTGPTPSPGRSGEPASSDRSGGASSSAASAADRECKQWKQRNQAGDRSPSPVEETAVRPKQRRKKEKRHLPHPGPEDDALRKEDSCPSLRISQARDRCANLQKAREAASDPPAEKKKGKRDGGPRALSMRPRPRHVWICKSEQEQQQQQHDKASSQYLKILPVPATDLCANLQEAGDGSAAPPTEEGSMKHTLLLEGRLKKKGCIDDANLVMEKSGMPPSHSSSMSGEAQEETSIDVEEASSPLSVEKQPKPTSSVDHGKVALDEDEEGRSGKNPPPVALNEIITHDEDGQNSDKIGVQAIEDYKQEQERIRGEAQALLELDMDDVAEKIWYYSRQLNHDPPEVDPDYMTEYEPQELIKLNERLALYRIRAYELSVDEKLDELDDGSLTQHYPPSVLNDEGYFRYYEESLEWYFNDELCNYAGFEDYQHIVLRSYGEYLDWSCYSKTRNTYAEDLAYVQYCEAIENETKWIEGYLLDNTLPWERVQNVARVQALKIAAGFPNVSPRLVFSGFREHMWSVKFDFRHKGLDAVYFEIWKRVAKQKMDFREALLEVYHGKMFPSWILDIDLELENTTRARFSMKDKYNAYVACIDDLVSEDAAHPLITEAVKKMISKPKIYVDYARKKLDIAKQIGLTTKGARPQATPAA
ncbi:uncharacterized protein LOC120671227 isoform X2 [Panicum virgatum]|uniref:uncharacterized protein LOC120671227 isoform X2 n=1 Tax=Panicum virgatum TaxID=38727 RepID=UPI0019D5C724|nr:uncharacterized protein LOC120671227 isoform X2 [Panicum virgatum]